MRRPSPRSKLGKLLVYAPIVLELIRLMRRGQHSKRSKYTKARKRDQAFDFMLHQAEKRLGKRSHKRRF